MSQAELMYQNHLNVLRAVAKGRNRTFAYILYLLSEAYERPGLYLTFRDSDDEKRRAPLENQLIKEYRPKYFEEIVNSNLLEKDALSKAAKIDAQQLAKAKENDKKAQSAIKVAAVQEQNLLVGRQKGATRNKQRASAIRSLARKINSDLLTHVKTARWAIDKRAEYIEEILAASSVEIDGSLYPAAMLNGRNYARATIRTWIIGT